MAESFNLPGPKLLHPEWGGCGDQEYSGQYARAHRGWGTLCLEQEKSWGSSKKRGLQIFGLFLVTLCHSTLSSWVPGRTCVTSQAYPFRYFNSIKIDFNLAQDQLEIYSKGWSHATVKPEAAHAR